MLNRAIMLILLVGLMSCCGWINQSNQPTMTTEQVRQTAVVATHTHLKPAQSKDVDAMYKGAYINPTFGYSIVIPKGLTGFSSPPPAPQHGVRIDLSASSEEFMWVDGSYNAAEYGSLEEAIDAEIELLKKEGTDLKVIKRVPANLQKFRAIELVASYQKIESGETMIENLILAIRKNKDDIGLVYEIGLLTLEANYTKDKKNYKQLVRTWMPKPLPE